jgi:hypothetical protein
MNSAGDLRLSTCRVHSREILTGTHYNVKNNGKRNGCIEMPYRNVQAH